MTFARHLLALAGMAFAAMTPIAPTHAETYPSRPITLVVPFPAGGVTDLAARLVATRLGETLKQPVIVDNRAGAAGRIGAEAVARARPDGYTLLFGLSVTHGMLMASTNKPTYDPIKSFTPIAPLFWYSSVLICNPSVPAKNLKELVAYAKTKPDGLTYGSAGIGSGVHFNAEYLAMLTGIKMLHVPFRGGASALQAVVGGQVDCSFDGAAKSHIAAGTVRAIATSGPTRDIQYPDVPTIKESGYPGFDMTIWQALFAPAQLPPDVTARLRAAMQEVAASPTYVEQAKALGLNILPGDAADLQKLIAAEVEKYQSLSRELRISFE
ncbi:tripartite tricarboxylate transporter substrate binding protein [Variovorax sp. Sphag1AA]|uniref:Bug family tripartite tricarboxylate transporter substrate binding protein n=1 Tax=Variovorax sp. Sphag1AA TaxID=2587027 RepID=UPI00161675BB|nr:tripartite tricarboxylate transporter substrate binding protein [Variovorax sp. Sphag1AA]MBB3178738.1 tripartite-type tricarboxylate transporter receptor subunit TctC [Variovorax sp. Sphag1AA]